MNKDDLIDENTHFVSQWTKRALAVKALKKIFTIVKQIERQDNLSRYAALLAGILIIILAISIIIYMQVYEARNPTQPATSYLQQ